MSESDSDQHCSWLIWLFKLAPALVWREDEDNLKESVSGSHDVGKGPCFFVFWESYLDRLHNFLSADN